MSFTGVSFMAVKSVNPTVDTLKHGITLIGQYTKCMN